jgi:hypothetical protein
MRMESKQKNHKQNLKKESIVLNLKTGMTGIPNAAGNESDRIPDNLAVANSMFTGVSDEERHQLIAEAAYYHAEHRSFEPGHELEDWLTAEAEIKRKVSDFEIVNLRKHT